MRGGGEMRAVLCRREEVESEDGDFVAMMVMDVMK